MHTEGHLYRGYEIVLLHNPPLWRVAIYPTKDLAVIDWSSEPISNESAAAVLEDAKRRVNESLGQVV